MHPATTTTAASAPSLPPSSCKLAACGHWAAIYSPHRGILLWDWAREKTIPLPHGAHCAPNSAVEELVVLRSAGNEAVLLVAVLQRCALVWDLSENGLHGAVHGAPRRVEMAMMDEDVAQNASARRVAMKVAGPECVEGGKVTLGPAPKDQEGDTLVDACRVSQWFAVGITRERVVWIRNAAVMFQFDKWNGTGKRKVDKENGEVEELVAISANANVVCVASSFGSVYVLEKKTFDWVQTLPIGMLIQSMSMPKVQENILVILTAEGSVHVVDIENAEIIDYYDIEGLGSGSPASPSQKILKKPCPCCGTQWKEKDATTCVLVSNNSFFACRNKTTGKTVVRSKRVGTKSVIIASSKGSSILKLVGMAVVACGELENELVVVHVDDERCFKVASFRLDGRCICFDVDFDFRNRIVAISETGNVMIFKFSSKTSQPIQTIHFEGPCPTSIAAHSGKLALASTDDLVVLYSHGKGCQERFEKSFPYPILALAWDGPFNLIINHHITLPIPAHENEDSLKS